MTSICNISIVRKFLYFLSSINVGEFKVFQLSYEKKACYTVDQVSKVLVYPDFPLIYEMSIYLLVSTKVRLFWN